MQPKRSQDGPRSLAEELAALQNLDVNALKQRWRILYRTEPPVRISRALLLLAVAYRLQEQNTGRPKIRDPPPARTSRSRVRFALSNQTTRDQSDTRHRADARMAWGEPCGDGACGRGVVPRHTLPLALRGSAPDHGHALVGAAVLWTERGAP